MALRFKVFFSVLFLFLTSPAWANLFQNQYCEFRLPSGWECALEGTEWVCQSTNEDRRREAIIILAAKVRGPQDSLDQYQSYLEQTKTFTLPGGRTQVSEPKYAQTKSINNHRWIDALHLASEVPGFYTRYLATVKEDLGVAVTFSVAMDHYDDYRDVFDRMVESLKVFRQAGADTSDFQLRRRDEDLLGDRAIIPDGGRSWDISPNQRDSSRGGSSAGDSGLWLILAVAAVGGVIALKKLKGKKKVGKKKTSKKASKKTSKAKGKD